MHADQVLRNFTTQARFGLPFPDWEQATRELAIQNFSWWLAQGFLPDPRPPCCLAALGRPHHRVCGRWPVNSPRWFDHVEWWRRRDPGPARVLTAQPYHGAWEAHGAETADADLAGLGLAYRALPERAWYFPAAWDGQDVDGTTVLLVLATPAILATITD